MADRYQQPSEKRMSDTTPDQHHTITYFDEASFVPINELPFVRDGVALSQLDTNHLLYTTVFFNKNGQYRGTCWSTNWPTDE